MKAINRLYTYLGHKDIKPTIFEREIGFSSGYLSNMRKRDADLGESVLIKINDYCQDLNLLWLLTGKGEMLCASPLDASDAPTPSEYKNLLDRIQELAIENHELKKQLAEVKAQKKARTIHEPYSMVAESKLEYEK